MTITVARDGAELGTYDKDGFAQALYSREVLPTDHYWTDGMADWLPVSSYAKHAALVAAPQPIQSPATVSTIPERVPGYSGRKIAIVILGVAVLMMGGCVLFATVMEKVNTGLITRDIEAAKFDAQKQAQIDAQNEDWIAQHKVQIGMNADQCRRAWGAPRKINTTVNARGRSEQWCYASGSYLYLDDGVLTSLQK